jgi:hypothetical protein
MKNAFECRAYAEECRGLAERMNEEHRQQTLDMAELWESWRVRLSNSSWPKWSDPYERGEGRRGGVTVVAQTQM